MSKLLKWLENKIALSSPLEFGAIEPSDPNVEMKLSELMKIQNELVKLENENEELKKLCRDMYNCVDVSNGYQSAQPLLKILEEKEEGE